MNTTLTISMMVGALGAGFSAPVFMRVARRFGLVDRPEGRKQHHGAIPLAGGMAIFLGYVLALLVLGEMEFWRGGIFWACLVLLAVGLWDDVGHVPVGLRIVIQITVIIFLCLFSGIKLERLGMLYGDEPVLLYNLALPLTILGLIGIKNGINLIDGLDGLAGSQVLAVLFWFTVLSLHNGISMLAMLSLPLAGAVLGFLYHNLRLPGRPARVFLGDHGSVFLGLALGWFAIMGSQLPDPAFSPIQAVWVLGLPILDTVRVMLSRMLRGRSPFEPGRDHIHHLLLGLGLSSNATVAVLLLFSLLLGMVAWGANLIALSEQFLFCAFLGLSVIFFLAAQRIESRTAGQGSAAGYDRMNTPGIAGSS